ncbi:hypothetical protein [Nonomuraea sp. NPDC052265]|uniref:hypothetical protein n=1 Tax=Nonomuraea sp. NPDC052265 TaxID=3364374 RepID=UPI0037CA2CA8
MTSDASRLIWACGADEGLVVALAGDVRQHSQAVDLGCEGLARCPVHVREHHAGAVAGEPPGHCGFRCRRLPR